MSVTMTDQMMHPNLPNLRPGLRARFGDSGPYGPKSVPVIGWDESGFPLVFDHRDWSLYRAHRIPGFLCIVEEVKT